MSYLDFLTFLIGLGPKLPEVFARIQRIVAEVQELVALVRGPDEGTLRQVEAPALSKREAKAEEEVMALLAPESDRALFDGTLIRQVLTFIRENPELIAFLFSLFGKKA